MDRRRCAVCGEIIDITEPVVLVLADGSTRGGSLLTLGEQVHLARSGVVHAGCYEQLEPYVSLARGPGRPPSVLARPEAALAGQRPRA